MKPFFSFGYPFFLKVVIPGLVAAVALNPLIAVIGIKLGIAVKMYHALSIAILGISLGFLINFIDDIIYKILEGYRLWPKWLRIYYTNRLNERIQKRFEEYKYTQDQIKKGMLWDWLITFPLKKTGQDIQTEAVLPTRLGNILHSYEDYPQSRYGMNSVFFWPRLWLVLDKDTRNEFNTITAEADCVTYISFVLFSVSMLYFMVFVLHLTNLPTIILGPFGRPVDSLSISKLAFSPFFFLGIAILLFVLFLAFYRISLPLHVRNGDFFKSLFDVHRGKLESMLSMEENSKERWKDTMNYLEFMLTK